MALLEKLELAEDEIDREKDGEGQTDGEGPPKRRRGRPKGSGKGTGIRKQNQTIEIDNRLCSTMVDLCFASIVSFLGDSWAPLDYEKDLTSSNLKLVLEKRLPSGASENLPEYALALTLIFYTSRCLAKKYETKPRSNGGRTEGQREERIPQA